MTPEPPLISVVILNYNGRPWLQRCLDSIWRQTLFDRTELILADNASSDGSDHTAEMLLKDWPNGYFLQNGRNLGFCGGNNAGARLATGRYLFFLNNDTWLEEDCLEALVQNMEDQRAGAGGAQVLNYEDDSFQSVGGNGIDWMGFPNASPPLECTTALFATTGCAYVIRRDVFERIGGFDEALFLYSDETDLSWRVWIGGWEVIGIPSARVHHRGAVDVNPKGGGRVVEVRTSALKRYYANRNGIILILKNAHHFLLLLLVPHLAYLVLEAVASLLLLRNSAFCCEAYGAAVRDAFRMLGHVRSERRAIRGFRRNDDFWMMRFLRLKPSRLQEVVHLLRRGVPRID